jgi:hypothetical protein
MEFSDIVSFKGSAALLVAAFAVAQSIAAPGDDDYVADISMSHAAQAYFKAVPENLKGETVSRSDPVVREESNAYYTEDGGISIPPGAMIVFKNAGKCMDPHLPAPSSGEPMQFINAERLIPRQLQDTYRTLLERNSRGDPKVAANNLQHLVWAIRTAGTEDPLANNLSGRQLDLLDACSGRHGAFSRFHERQKKRNAKRKRNRAQSRISVGSFSYDASELRGTNATRLVSSHIETLTEMGNESKIRSSNNLRYGEIEEDLYSDVVCEGGLAFSARILNASSERKEFRAADFAAQVGNGIVTGSRRQRVTMAVPNAFTVIKGAVKEGVSIDRDVSLAEETGFSYSRVRRRMQKGRRARQISSSSEKTIESKKTERKRTTKTTTVVEEVPPVPAMEPVAPIGGAVVTNEVFRPIVEPVRVRVIALEYDVKAETGVLTVEILSGSFKSANKYIRDNFEELVKKRAKKDGVKGSFEKLEIMEFSISDDARCDVKFKREGTEK